MCVCFNHSNLVPTAEPSGDRKQKRVWDEGAVEGGGERWREEGGLTGGGGGLEIREMREGDKMAERRSEGTEWGREGVLRLLCQTGADCNLHASPAILLRLLLRNHQEKKLSQHFC